MKKSLNFITILMVLVFVGMLWALPATAKVIGQCADCHTMHNTDASGAIENSAGPQRALTKGGCVGCHTGTNTANIGTVDQPIPYVLQTTEPTYGPDYGADGTLSNAGNTLAGGNFYWVATGYGADDTTGHNVETDSLCGADGTLGNTPPGFVSGWGTAGIGATWASNQLTCAGTYGCHGSHTYADDFADISGAHHADDTTLDGSTVGKSFRFCYKILGKEFNTGGNAWEYQPTAALHNQYKGYDRDPATTEPVLGNASGGNTINFFCGECHGLYHSSATTDTGGAGGLEKGGVAQNETNIGQDPWLRHPSDYDMGNTIAGSEYRYYADMSGTLGNGTTSAYNPVAPLASEDISAVLSSVTFGATDNKAIVNCISCHRAHGSPYADLLRWDYLTYMKAGTSTPAGWNNKGCFACHTTKDAG